MAERPPTDPRPIKAVAVKRDNATITLTVKFGDPYQAMRIVDEITQCAQAGKNPDTATVTVTLVTYSRRITIEEEVDG